MERSAGAKAGASTRGTGLHSGAGAEDPQNFSHSASVGAGPLPGRQTNIVWPVVGVEGDRDFRIMGRGAGNRQADLRPSAQTLGATTMALGTSGPPDESAAKACDSDGSPGRILASVGSGGPGTRDSGTGAG